MIDIRDSGSVRVLTLASGKVNALDVELLTDLGAALRAAQDSGARALVLSGAGVRDAITADLDRLHRERA